MSGNAAFRSVYNALVPQAQHCLSDNNNGNQPSLIYCAWRFEIISCNMCIEFLVLLWLARASTDLKLLLRMNRMKSEFDLCLFLYAFAVSRLQHALTVPFAVLSRPSALWVPGMLCLLCRQALRTGSQNLCSLYSYHFVSESNFVLKGKSAEKCGWMMLASL